ncbi:MAG: LptA/OstA family protein [Kiritimatiellae bacterium]|nr:LptA/OstA family protein [Kiritimatiellia bacterium]MDW8457811.1 LptA/OstA family protein [Verrucomicrobiota bacterium]
MKRICPLYLIPPLVFALATGAFGQTAPEAEDNLTVITSDRLTFDYQKQFALFDKNVVVVDPEMRLYADRLTVRFGPDNKAQEIKAEGRVHIIQADKEARAEIAIYNLIQGVIILTGKPQITRGKDVLTGEKITFWRDQNRLLVEPRARLILQSEPGQNRPNLLDEALRGR